MLGEGGMTNSVEQLRCEICGKAADLTALGSRLCPSCAARYREFRCSSCGQRVMYLVEFATLVLGVAENSCGTCSLRNRLSELAKNDREAILSAAANGKFFGIKEIQARLGWSLREAVEAIQILQEYI
jgi:hypothetical protein